MPKLIAITIGDIRGIGIDILINTWKKKEIKNFILLTNIDYINKYLLDKKLKIKLNLVNYIEGKINFKSNELNIFTYKCNSLEDNTYKSLKYAYDLCKINICKGIITLPIRKDLIIKKINRNFTGHTEYFQQKDKKKFSNMILYHEKIIITSLTTHIKINSVSKKISNKKFIYNQLFNLYKTLKSDFKIKNPKIIMSGLNPHAGENGNLGNEEKKYLIPVINKLKKNSINITGPQSPDSMLINKNIDKYDCFVFMYHDQALIPFKFISQFNGVNFTGNLSIIRTSPDHGTAYDLKELKQFSNKSFLKCYKLINSIYKNRMSNEKS